jgi:hypothetical protein
MLKVSASISTLKFDARKYQTRLIKVAEEEQRNAIRAWVLAVAVKIPTYTGTALGTIAPVAQAVGIVLSASNSTNKKFFKYRGRTYPLGFEQGAKYQTHSITHKVLGNSIEYTFKFNEQLPYVVWNTLQPAPNWLTLKNSTPWFALQDGVQAYVTYARTEMPKRLPKPARFYTVKVVKVV